MRKTTRYLLFYFFAAVFFVSAPLIVLYTAGYRISLNNYRVLETGAIAVSTTPKGANITVDTKTANNKSPTVVQNVLPQTVPVRLTKTGYIPWQDAVQVTSGQTTFVTTILYADEAAEVIASFPNVTRTSVSGNGRYLTLYETVSGQERSRLYDVVIREEKNISSVVLPPPTGDVVKIVDNGKNVEVRSSKGPNDLLALLPQGTYEILIVDDDFLVLRDTRKMITIISLAGADVVTLDVPGELWAWLPDSHLLTWSDGIEVNAYDAVERQRTFLTRQSEVIQTLIWHPTGDAVIFSTSSHVTALDLEEHESRVSTLLLMAQGTITDIWVDKNAKTLYLMETVKGVPTLYRRKLVK